jgi:hypothetical protein
MKKKNPHIMLRESDVKKMKRDASDKALKYGLVLFLTVMRDKEGYGIKRLKRVYDNMQELADSINKGYVNLFDLEKTLQEEANINIFMKVGEGS